LFSNFLSLTYQGAAFFDYSERWNLIATGGADCHVRLWNPYVPTHPTALLKGHATAVAFVSFSPEYGQVFSLATNEVIKIWDIKDQVCLLT
jgi:WD40 repeat protein